MKPDGSTRRTRAVQRLAAAPLLDDAPSRRAGCARRRSTAGRRRSRVAPDRQSRAAARRPARPTRSRAAVSGRRRRPAPRRSTVRPPGRRRLQPRPRQLQLVFGARDGELGGAQRFFGRLARAVLRRLELVARRWRRPWPAPPGGRSVVRARAARPRRGPARPAPARRRARGLDRGGQLGARPRVEQRRRRPASGAPATVLPRTTGSPGSSSMRCSRPATGAETTNRSRTRVSPSSSMVTCIGAARRRWPTSTSIDSGHSATATMAATTSTAAMSRACLTPAHQTVLSGMQLG